MKTSPSTYVCKTSFSTFCSFHFRIFFNENVDAIIFGAKYDTFLTYYSLQISFHESFSTQTIEIFFLTSNFAHTIKIEHINYIIEFSVAVTIIVSTMVPISVSLFDISMNEVFAKNE